MFSARSSLLILLLCFAGRIQAGFVYTIDSTTSSFTLSNASAVVPLGPGTTTIQIVDQHLLRASGDLRSRLGGTFMADPGLGVLQNGFPITELDPLLGGLTFVGNPVGQVSVGNLAFSMIGNSLTAASGNGTFSTSPPFNTSGNFSLVGMQLNAGSVVFGPGGTTVSFQVNYSGLIPTGNNNFVLSGTLNGQINANLSAVPEPSSLICVAVLGLGILVGRSFRRSPRGHQ